MKIRKIFGPDYWDVILEGYDSPECGTVVECRSEAAADALVEGFKKQSSVAVSVITQREKFAYGSVSGFAEPATKVAPSTGLQRVENKRESLAGYQPSVHKSDTWTGMQGSPLH